LNKGPQLITGTW